MPTSEPFEQFLEGLIEEITKDLKLDDALHADPYANAARLALVKRIKRQYERSIRQNHTQGDPRGTRGISHEPHTFLLNSIREAA